MTSDNQIILVFPGSSLELCFFGVLMIPVGSALPSLVTKLELSGLQTKSLATSLPISVLVGSVSLRLLGTSAADTKHSLGAPFQHSLIRDRNDGCFSKTSGSLLSPLQADVTDPYLL